MNLEDKSAIRERLIELVKNPIKIRSRNLNRHILHTFDECLQFCFNSKESDNISKCDDYVFYIESILNYLHEELNTGHWSSIPIEIRHNFTIASFLKAVLLLRSSEHVSNTLLQQCLKSLDMGLLLGAPLEENEDILTECAKYICTKLNFVEPDTKSRLSNINSEKRKLVDSDFPKGFYELVGQTIEELNIPSIETFNKKFFVPQIPVKLKGCMVHWPALTKWLDLNYLLKVAGNRTVPVEIGAHYTDEDWSQKLMTLKDFIVKHYLSESGDVGYLAQHNLFDQISELKEDVRIPEYCCCSVNYEDATDPDINAWLGPKGTVSPLHQDPKNNILAQVYGMKQILLFSPDDTSYLYPHGEKMLSNTAQIDPLNPDYSQFPDYSKARMYKCLLEPGEMLFIPVKWWHHVTALEKSFSVSFWWQ